MTIKGREIYVRKNGIVTQSMQLAHEEGGRKCGKNEDIMRRWAKSITKRYASQRNHLHRSVLAGNVHRGRIDRGEGTQLTTQWCGRTLKGITASELRFRNRWERANVVKLQDYTTDRWQITYGKSEKPWSEGNVRIGDNTKNALKLIQGTNDN